MRGRLELTDKGRSDTDAEVAAVEKAAKAAGADAVAACNHWAEGGEGAIALAQAVIEACKEPNPFEFLYGLDIPIKDKISAIATKMYGAKDVTYSEEAEKQVESYTRQGFDKFPICMAKTHLSLSHDPKLKGRPEGTLPSSAVIIQMHPAEAARAGFTVPIRTIKMSAGAGFLYPIVGDM